MYEDLNGEPQEELVSSNIDIIDRGANIATWAGAIGVGLSVLCDAPVETYMIYSSVGAAGLIAKRLRRE